MKKYLVVAWDGYYPLRELENIQFHSDSYEEADKVKSFVAKFRHYDNVEIIERDCFVPDNQSKYEALLKG